jgi:hypothetical protein
LWTGEPDTEARKATMTISQYTIVSGNGEVLWTGLAADGESAMDLMERQTGVAFDATKNMGISREPTDLVDCGRLSI